MLRRLYHDQPESFAFTPANQEWAEAQLTKFPEGRQASALIPLLWRAQEQEGWLSRPAMEEVARMLDLAYIRVLEVATFYFMFQLQPVGSVAHIQVCGTTSCMICGAEDLIGVCKEKIARKSHQLSEDGRFSWEEVECLGACANAPMAQIGKDYYEDLSAESLSDLIDRMAAGEVPQPGSQIGRFASEPRDGRTSLADEASTAHNASVALALDIGDTLKRIDGTETPLRTPWREAEEPAAAAPPPVNEDLLPPKDGPDEPISEPLPSKDEPVAEDGVTVQESRAERKGRPEEGSVVEGQSVDDGISSPVAAGSAPPESAPEPGQGRENVGGGDGPLSAFIDEQEDDALNAEAAQVAEGSETAPARLDAPRGGAADDLKRIRGIGPGLEAALHSMGIFHLDQVASWTASEIAWVDRNLEGFRGRVVRDNWVGQARRLTS